MQKGRIALGGAMRADSPGHSAKYRSYTMMELDSENVLDIQLVQNNEVGGSFYMEKDGLQRSLDLLQANNIEVTVTFSSKHIA